MPFVDKATRAVLLLYQRCHERRALPEAGGVLDQTEPLMQDFDVIDTVIAEMKKKRDEERELRLRTGER